MPTSNAQRSTLNIERADSLNVEGWMLNASDYRSWTFFKAASHRGNCVKHRYLFSCSKHSGSS